MEMVRRHQNGRIGRDARAEGDSHVYHKRLTESSSVRISIQILGLDAFQCQGEHFVRWCAEESWIPVYTQFERAAEAKWSLGGGTWNKPQAISVTLHTRTTGRDPPGKVSKSVKPTTPCSPVT